jgi:uncharacterized protein (DUF302 family)
MPERVNGLISKPSRNSVAETTDRFTALLKARGILLFALIDHSGEAEKAGLKMPPTKLLIFGNPKGGTPVMLAAPTIAIDLPLRVLVWEDSGGKTWITFNEASYLQERHNVPAELVKNIAVVEALVDQVLAQS